MSRRDGGCLGGMRVKKYQTVFHAGYCHPKTRDVVRLSKSVKKNKIRYVTVF